MKYALVTICIGKRYQFLFKRYSMDSFVDYSKKNGLDLIILDSFIDQSLNRNPAWQKTLLPNSKLLQKYDRVLFVDSDVIIKKNSPNIFDCVPNGHIGYCREIPLFQSVSSWYTQFGLPPFNEIVQTGVLCFENQHGEIFQKRLHFPETEFYEMPCLSFSILESGLGFNVDPRFNFCIFPSLLESFPRWLICNKVLKEILWYSFYPPFRKKLLEIYNTGWFIHAAGAKRDLARIKQISRN